MIEDIIKIDINELAQYGAIKTKIFELAEKCSNVIVNSQESCDYAKNLTKESTKISKWVEETRKKITKPILDKKKEVDDFAKSLVGDLNTAIQGIRKGITSFEVEQEKNRREELRKIEDERKAKEEAERKAREAAEAKLKERSGGFLGNQELLDSIRKKEEAEEERIRGEAKLSIKEAQLNMQKSSSLRMVWTFDVADENIVPRDFCSVDAAKIKSAIKSGVREIPGVKIYQREDLYLR